MSGPWERMQGIKYKRKYTSEKNVDEYWKHFEEYKKCVHKVAKIN